jgi:hypothetical protein
VADPIAKGVAEADHLARIELAGDRQRALTLLLLRRAIAERAFGGVEPYNILLNKQQVGQAIPGDIHQLALRIAQVGRGCGEAGKSFPASIRARRIVAGASWGRDHQIELAIAQQAYQRRFAVLEITRDREGRRRGGRPIAAVA